jgi:hypothetical protein
MVEVTLIALISSCLGVTAKHLKEVIIIIIIIISPKSKVKLIRDYRIANR